MKYNIVVWQLFRIKMEKYSPKDLLRVYLCIYNDLSVFLCLYFSPSSPPPPTDHTRVFLFLIEDHGLFPLCVVIGFCYGLMTVKERTPHVLFLWLFSLFLYSIYHILGSLCLFNLCFFLPCPLSGLKYGPCFYFWPLQGEASLGILQGLMSLYEVIFRPTFRCLLKVGELTSILVPDKFA